MRALYLRNNQFEEYSEILLENDDFHHLVNVLRAKEGQEILLLNGRGIKAQSIIAEIQKKNISLKISKVEQAENIESPILGLCIPKKEYLENALKSCIELGVKELYLFESDYSQKLELKESRIQKILKSAYEQSNNAFEIKLIEAGPLVEFDFNIFEEIYFFNSQASNMSSPAGQGNKKQMVLIGPEGGFSSEEIGLLKSLKNSKEVSLTNKPIMRSVTAIPFAFGYMMH